jgi:hypothetical protein
MVDHRRCELAAAGEGRAAAAAGAMELYFGCRHEARDFICPSHPAGSPRFLGVSHSESAPHDDFSWARGGFKPWARADRAELEGAVQAGALSRLVRRRTLARTTAGQF